MTMAAAPAAQAPATDPDKAPPMTPLSNQIKLSLLAISVTSFLDLVGYMAIMPSLIYYVRELGGTEGQYGLILSAPALVMFLMTPVYGHRVDSSGNKYRAVLLVGNGLCIAGMLMYAFAVVFGEGAGMWALLLSRVVYGIGGAAGTVGFTYLTNVVEHDQLTFCTLLLSVAGNVGLMFGPLVNTFLSGVDTHLWGIPLNPYNSVGLLIAANDAIGLVLVYFFLPEPKGRNEKESALSQAAAKEASTRSVMFSDDAGWAGWMRVFGELRRLPLLLPMITIFVVSANYQLIEAAFAPAASHGLGWGPVQTSAVLGSSAILLLAVTFLSMALTTTFKVPDSTMIIGGYVLWFVSGLMMYSLWRYPALAWHYVAPVAIGLVGFPLIGPATQSRFSHAIMVRPELEAVQARLQSVMAMAGSVAGFVTPLFVGAFILRSPDEVEADGADGKELTPYALYIPIFSVMIIAGWFYLEMKGDETEGEVELEPTEASRLVKKRSTRRSSVLTIRTEFSAENEAARLVSTSSIRGIHGMPLLQPFDTDDEKHRRQSLWEEKKLWEEMVGLLDDPEKEVEME